MRSGSEHTHTQVQASPHLRDIVAMRVCYVPKSLVPQGGRPWRRVQLGVWYSWLHRSVQLSLYFCICRVSEVQEETPVARWDSCRLPQLAYQLWGCAPRGHGTFLSKQCVGKHKLWAETFSTQSCRHVCPYVCVGLLSCRIARLPIYVWWLSCGPARLRIYVWW